MTVNDVTATLDDRFSSPGSEPVRWEEATRTLAEAGVYWVSTVREDGRPHVTPVAGVVLDDSLYFSTGPGEQKALNLARNPACAVTVGQSDFWSGLDIVLEGEVIRVTDPTTLQSLNGEFRRKYNDFFGFSADDGIFRNGAGGVALVYRVAARKGFGFARGEAFSQIRWTLSR